MLKKLIVLAIAFTPALLIAQAPVKGPLDGRKYTAEITENGKKKPLDPDDLTFNAGKFKSSLFTDWGFNKASKYDVTGIDSTTTAGVKIYSWTCELESKEEEKLAWSGTVAGEEIEGTIELVGKKGAIKKTYTFTGKLKKKPGQK